MGFTRLHSRCARWPDRGASQDHCGGRGDGHARRRTRQAILADKGTEFTVRALTRKVDSEKAKVLEEAGATVVAADLDQRDSLERAFSGAYGAFCLTNFWEHFSPDRELTQAKNVGGGREGYRCKA